MDTVIDNKLCTGCHACFNGCPVRAISMQEDEEGFLYPVIDSEKCIDCGKCRKLCPVLNPPAVNPGETSFACAASDRNERLGSSSGAVFALLAKDILRLGGVVCGAAYLAPDHVAHILVEEQNELALLRGTKYVQSEIGDAYRKVGEALKEGRRVLFCGTGCQVSGLKNYLGEDSDLLLTVDIICHGVPAPAVWRDYLKDLAGESRVVEAAFRVKNPDDKKTGFRCRLEDGTEILHEQKDDLYVKGFLQNLYLRHSCFACHFKGSKRCSDITIGDFWSAKEFHPALDDGLGVSAVLTHSEKGEAVICGILPQMSWERAKPEEAAYWNECLLESVKPSEKRAVFYSRWRQEDLLPLLDELTASTPAPPTKAGITKRVLRKIKRIFS